MSHKMTDQNLALTKKFFCVAATAGKIAGAAFFCTYFPEITPSLTFLALAKLRLDQMKTSNFFTLRFSKDSPNKVLNRFSLLAGLNACGCVAHLGFVPPAWRLPDGQPALNFMSAGKSAFFALACVAVAYIVNRGMKKSMLQKQ